MKVFLFVFVATLFEAAGDAIVRIALHESSTPARIGLYLTGALALTLYGTSLNLAPVEFAQVTGIYIATLFVMFQISNYVFFHARPTTSVVVGGGLIIAGGLIVGLLK
jgi:small multidrug resistance family-3 protein